VKLESEDGILRLVDSLVREKSFLESQELKKHESEHEARWNCSHSD